MTATRGRRAFLVNLSNEAEEIAAQIGAGGEHTGKMGGDNSGASPLDATNRHATLLDLENRNQLLVRMLTQNLDEAIRARREQRKPVYKD